MLKKYLIVCSLIIAPLFAISTSEVHAQSGFEAKPILKTSRTLTGQPIRYPQTTATEVSSVMVEIEPGGESGRHKHPVSPHMYVIQGAVTIEFDNGDRKVFSAGDAFIEAVNTWHNAKNLGDTPMKMLVVFFSEKGQTNLIRP